MDELTIKQEIDKWETQFRKGLVEVYVMQAIHHLQHIHGYELLEFLSDQGLTITEGTLYPLLNRLEKNGWLSSSWEVPKSGGHPKRQYQLSDLGEQLAGPLSKRLSHYQNIANKMRDL